MHARSSRPPWRLISVATLTAIVPLRAQSGRPQLDGEPTQDPLG